MITFSFDIIYVLIKPSYQKFSFWITLFIVGQYLQFFGIFLVFSECKNTFSKLFS